ncbi:hypothetical protein GUITHDRAFT_112363 [Guillardia theta CCMP2712]|uniref:Uncharacterized protein n=1 Tax=Guillardia theta (strain CCMP2712) TaxID=905079 RepID=L1IZZ0_GUITC|nr:hypothetical protein GUITHDRAFT_112363 [Guillardia theta CCMP2712]EKX41657.1 hypothetical protein GUITHDRAFT_112363 [Guillardia theta CCMP2712]|eukprot:XP_005828637.1 hypothetical protein GUITHDRAFT_112363 [Guillardia theta CCMP2712]
MSDPIEEASEVGGSQGDKDASQSGSKKKHQWQAIRTTWLKDCEEEEEHAQYAEQEEGAEEEILPIDASPYRPIAVFKHEKVKGVEGGGASEGSEDEVGGVSTIPDMMSNARALYNKTVNTPSMEDHGNMEKRRTMLGKATRKSRSRSIKMDMAHSMRGKEALSIRFQQHGKTKTIRVEGRR